MWIDDLKGVAFKGQSVALDGKWGLLVDRQACFYDGKFGGASMWDVALNVGDCDAKRNRWAWTLEHRRVPLMAIDPGSVRVVSGTPQRKARGSVVVFTCNGKSCWNQIDEDGILCRTAQDCAQVASDLKSLRTMGGAAGAKSDGVFLPAPDDWEAINKTLDKATADFEHPIAKVDLDDVKEAAEESDRDAQNELGRRYFEGKRGAPLNQFEGVRWFQEAANNAHTGGQFNLAQAYQHGLGVRPSLTEALRWYQASVKTGNFQGQLQVKLLEDARKGFTNDDTRLLHAMWLFEAKDYLRAREVFLPLAKRGYVLAHYFIGKTYNDRLGAPDAKGYAKPEMEEAHKWYRTAAQNGFVWAQVDLADGLAIFYWFDHEPEVFAEAKRWYEAAGRSGWPEAKQKIAELGLSSGELDLDSWPGPPAGVANSGGAGGAGGAGTRRTAPATRSGPTENSGQNGVLPDPFPPPSPPASREPARSAPARCARVPGEWQWTAGTLVAVLNFGSNGIVGANPTRGAPPVLFGTWACNEAQGTMEIRWQNGFVEQLTIAPGGDSITGTNNIGMPIRGSALR